MFYENVGVKSKKLYRVLSCAIYFIIDTYVCIDCLFFQSKTLSIVSSNRILEQTRFNILLGIGIPELLQNLVSCHGFMEKLNSIFVLNFWSRLVNNYLAKGIFVIEKDSKYLSIIPNYVKLRIHVIDQLKTDFVMAKNTSIFYVANTINKLHIQSHLHLIYKQNF